jgi:hypothetical protein
MERRGDSGGGAFFNDFIVAGLSPDPVRAVAAGRGDQADCDQKRERDG